MQIHVNTSQNISTLVKNLPHAVSQNTSAGTLLMQPTMRNREGALQRCSRAASAAS